MKVAKWFLVLSVLGRLALAVEGNEGHGGDGYVADFIRTGRLVHEWLSTNPSQVSPADFLKALESAKVESTEEVLLEDGIQKDALNYPGRKKIVLNRDRWKNLATERQRWQLVLHEVLGLLEKSDQKYEISEPIALAAVPDPDNVASRYRGTLPQCLAFFEIEGSWMLPVQIGLVEGKSGADLVWRTLHPNTTQITHEEVLLRGLKCEYSSYHPGVMRCANAAKEEFTVSKKTVVNLSPYGQQYDIKDPYFYYVIYFRGKEIESHYLNQGYTLVETFHPARSKVTPAQYKELENGNLPVFLSHLSYREGEALKKNGPKVLGDGFSIEIGRDFCGFAYPAQ